MMNLFSSSRFPFMFVLAAFLALGLTACDSNDADEPDPEPLMDIVDTAVDAGSFTTLVQAVQAANLVATLKSDGPFTVFAPTDEAFAKLDQGLLQSLLLPENIDQLTAILTYHVVPGKVLSSEVAGLSSATTAQGAAVTFDIDGESVMVNGANVVAVDIEATNGVIHVIDTVLLPPTE